MIDVYKEEERILLKALILAYSEEKELFANFKLSQEVRVEITANSFESTIIHKNIKSSIIKWNLLELNNRLKDEKIVEFYTDRAIAVNSERRNKMRIG